MPGRCKSSQGQSLGLRPWGSSGLLTSLSPRHQLAQSASAGIPHSILLAPGRYVSRSRAPELSGAKTCPQEDSEHFTQQHAQFFKDDASRLQLSRVVSLATHQASPLIESGLRNLHYSSRYTIPDLLPSPLWNSKPRPLVLTPRHCLEQASKSAQRSENSNEQPPPRLHQALCLSVDTYPALLD